MSPGHLPASAALLSPLAAVLLGGCIGPAASLTANGLVVGGDAIPADMDIVEPLEAMAFLALPLSATELERNYVNNADVWIEVEAGPSAELPASGNGLYVYDSELDEASEDALPYEAGATYRLQAERGGELHSVSIEAPTPPELWSLPGYQEHPPDTDLSIDLRDQGFDTASWVVLDAGFEVIADGRPSSNAEVMMDVRDSDGIDTLVVPGEAFPDGHHRYWLGVVGIRKAHTEDYSGFGTYWSTFGMGAWTLGEVVTGGSS